LAVLNIMLTKIVLFFYEDKFYPFNINLYFLPFAVLFVTFRKSYLLFCATNAIFLHYSFFDSAVLSAGLSIEHM